MATNMQDIQRKRERDRESALLTNYGNPETILGRMAIVKVKTTKDKINKNVMKMNKMNKNVMLENHGAKTQKICSSEDKSGKKKINKQKTLKNQVQDFDFILRAMEKFPKLYNIKSFPCHLTLMFKQALLFP